MLVVGAYFIDISPRYFDYVLEYLRTGQLNLEDADDNALAEIRILFNYFLLRYPGFDFCWDSQKCGSLIFISNNRLTIKKDNGVSGSNYYFSF